MRFTVCRRYGIVNAGLRAMAKGKFISYLRVSTDKQGRSGLGLEAQREAVTRYLNGGNWTVVAEYVETESGKRSDRPKLAAALGHAKAIGATLVFAKLDRLTRNVDLLRTLVASGVDLVFCDLPHVPPGAMGRFLLTQMASVAELEAGLISERTKAALAAAKARGVKLGNPNGARAMRGKQVGNRSRCGCPAEGSGAREQPSDNRGGHWAQGITSVRKSLKNSTAGRYSRRAAAMATDDRRAVVGAAERVGMWTPQRRRKRFKVQWGSRSPAIIAIRFTKDVVASAHAAA